MRDAIDLSTSAAVYGAASTLPGRGVGLATAVGRRLYYGRWLVETR